MSGNLVPLLVYIGVAAIVCVAVMAVLSKVQLDPAIRQIVIIALIVIVAILAIIFLVRLTGVAIG